MPSVIFRKIIFGFWDIQASTKDLFLVLYSWITPGGTQETICIMHYQRSNPDLLHRRRVSYLLFSLSGPILRNFYAKSQQNYNVVTQIFSFELPRSQGKKGDMFSHILSRI